MKVPEVDRISGFQFELRPMTLIIHLFPFYTEDHNVCSPLPLPRTFGTACNRYIAEVAKMQRKKRLLLIEHLEVVYLRPPLVIITAGLCNTITEVGPIDVAANTDDNAGSLHAPVFSGHGWNLSTTSHLRKGSVSFLPNTSSCSATYIWTLIIFVTADPAVTFNK